MWNATARKPPNQSALGLCLGVAFGSAMGVAPGNLAYGMGPGIAPGVALGVVLKKRHAPRSVAQDTERGGDGA